MRGVHFPAPSALWSSAHMVLDKKIHRVIKEGRETLVKPHILLTKEEKYFFREKKN